MAITLCVSLGMSVPLAYARTSSNKNLTLEFEKDREMVQDGNVVHVQSDSEYQKKQLSAMQERIDALEKKMAEVEAELKNCLSQVSSDKPTP